MDLMLLSRDARAFSPLTDQELYNPIYHNAMLKVYVKF